MATTSAPKQTSPEVAKQAAELAPKGGADVAARNKGQVGAILGGNKVKAAGRFGAKTIHWFDWSEGGGFTQSERTLAKGTALAQAARTTVNKDYAWIETDRGVSGYVRAKDLDVTTWGAPKAPRKAFDTPAPEKRTGANLLEETTASGNMYMETHREWYLDQAVLSKAYHEAVARGDGETAKRLALAMTQSFSKAAAVDQSLVAPKLGIQTTPFLGGKDYYRSNADADLNRRTQYAMAGDLGIPGSKKADTGVDGADIRVVSDPFFGEVLSREFPVYARGKEPAKAVPVETKIDSVKTFETSVDALFANTASDPDRAPDHTFTFDVTQLYKTSGVTPDTAYAQLGRRLEASFLLKATAFQTAHKGAAVADPAAIAAKLMNKLQLVAMLEQRGRNVVFVIPFFKPLEKAELDKQPEQEKALRQAVNQSERAELLTPGSHDGKKLDSAIIESGSRLDPLSAKETLLDIHGASKVLKDAGVHEVNLATRGPSAFKVATSIKEFLANGLMKRFRDLSAEKGAPPYQLIYPKATADLIAGLEKCKAPEGTIDEVFAKRQIGEVLQTSYYRILSAMGGAIQSKSEMIKFLNEIEVIHNQIQMILAIAQPYDPGVAFSKATVDRMREAPKDGSPTLPDDLNASVHHKSSAMHAVANVMAGVEAQKRANGGTEGVNAVILKDNYYETPGAFEHARTYDVTLLDGDAKAKPDDKKALAPEALRDPHDPSKQKQPAGPVDLFVCDFHHNISLDRTHYRVEEVSEQVDALLATGVSAQFTVAIDCTVDFVRSEDVRKFLERFKGQIAGGKMNVVLYRSAQKFDMLGMDNYYGGVTVTINDGTSFAAFTKRIDEKADQTPGLAHQGMAHLATNAGDHADEYRRLLMKNTKDLYDAIPGQCKFGADSPLQIALTDDPNAAFLDIQFPGYSEDFATTPSGFYGHFITWAHAEGLAFTTRPSFGFATTNFTLIAGSKVRLNPGLEDAKAIKKYAGYFTTVQRTLAAVETATLGGKKRTDLDAKGIADMEEKFAAALFTGKAGAKGLEGSAFQKNFEEWREANQPKDKPGAPAERDDRIDGGLVPLAEGESVKVLKTT